MVLAIFVSYTTNRILGTCYEEVIEGPKHYEESLVLRREQERYCRLALDVGTGIFSFSGRSDGRAFTA